MSEGLARVCVFERPDVPHDYAAHCKGYVQATAKAAHLAGVPFEFWAAYRAHRRGGDCMCQAAKAAAYDWDF